MQFSSSLFSSTILVLGYLTNAALCVPTDDSSKLVVNYNQQSFHSTGISTPTAVPLLNLIIPWLRDGLDPNVTYDVVRGQAAPLVKDHFIELQYFRNYLLNYTGVLSLDAFTTIVHSANSIDNVFSINTNLNSYKSRINLSKYVTDPRIHTYLCSNFTNSGTLVWQRVQANLNTMASNADPSVKAIGTSINAGIALGTLRCP